VALDGGGGSVRGVGGAAPRLDIPAAITGTNVPLGIIPAGAGNQVAAVLGIPLSPLAAAGAIEGAVERTIDLGHVTVRLEGGEVTDSTFIIGCGAGFDAELMATTSGDLKRRLGATAYFVQGARLAMRLSATHCRVTVDDELIETAATAVLVGNMGELVPGRLGLRLPLDPTDGQLDLIVVAATNPLSALRGLAEHLRRARLGGGVSDRSIRLRGKTIMIEPEHPLPLEVDGDHVGSGALEARIMPAALRVLAPASD
jgi:diacylglycerol kinase (ATP)